MSKVVSPQEISQRLRAVRKDGLSLDESTYKSTHEKARFVFKDGSEWWAIVKNVLNGASGPRTRVTVELVNDRVKMAHGDGVQLDVSTFINDRTKARFIDKDFGEWWASPKNVYALGNSHPKRGVLKRRDTCLDKYGSPNPTGNSEIKLKRDRNNIAKYGVAHVMQIQEVALKSAKKSNNPSVKIHWKTGEELICQASYEPKVVDYLNSNKIDYNWQSKTFTLDDGRTYRPDLFLINENKWIEIKGYFRKDAQEKWNWFQSIYQNSELWNEKKLKEMGIL